MTHNALKTFSEITEQYYFPHPKKLREIIGYSHYLYLSELAFLPTYSFYNIPQIGPKTRLRFNEALNAESLPPVATFRDALHGSDDVEKRQELIRNSLDIFDCIASRDFQNLPNVFINDSVNAARQSFQRAAAQQERKPDKGLEHIHLWRVCVAAAQAEMQMRARALKLG